MKTQIKSSLVLASVFAAVVSLASCTKDDISQIKPASNANATDRVALTDHNTALIGGLSKVPKAGGAGAVTFNAHDAIPYIGLKTFPIKRDAVQDGGIHSVGALKVSERTDIKQVN